LWLLFVRVDSFGPFCCVTIKAVPVVTESFCYTAELYKLWQSTDGCRQANAFLHGPDKQVSRFALGLKRRQVRILVGFEFYEDLN